jgi:protoporphyrinogen oxidase
MHVGIVGAGITGLTAAYWALKAGHRATVFEAASEAGGLAAAVNIQGAWVDKFYHCILPSDTALLDLVTELGLGEDIYWQDTGMGFMHGGHLYPLTGPRDLLRFSPLSMVDRLRLGLTGLYTRRLRDWKALEQVTARDWLVRFSGERAFNTIWKPLLVFKFGSRWDEAPATYLWARVVRQNTTRQRGARGERLAYVKGGFRRIIGTLADEVRRLGGTIALGTKVDRVVTREGRARGLDVHGAFQPFDKIVSSIPLTQLTRLLDPAVLGPGFAHDGIAYQGAINVLLALKERLTPYYWLPIVDSGVSFAGVVETTNLIRREDIGGLNLVYLVNYVPREDPLFSMDADALIARSLAELGSVFPAFQPGAVVEAHVHRAAFVEPVWTVNYSSRLPRPALLDDSLFVLTTAQLYPAINSTSNCVANVREILPRLLGRSDG